MSNVKLKKRAQHMSPNRIQQIIKYHWEFSNQRNWHSFVELLHPALRYECPQTREYVEGALDYLEMFRTWPGEWQVHIEKLICSDSEGISIIKFAVGAECMKGISIFEFDNKLISKVTDYWPEEYEPPVRATPVIKRLAP